MLMHSKSRRIELVNTYKTLLNHHLADLKSGNAEKTLEIADFARMLFVHPRHLSNTIQEVLGVSPCDLYENELLSASKQLLLESDMSIAAIARRLHYDPSNFNKFFKTYTGMTPGQFRKAGTTI